MGFLKFFKHQIANKQARLKWLLNNRHLSYVDKERILVQHTALSDMKKFNLLPYRMDFPVHRFIKERIHPFAYMNLSPFNINVAIRELQRVNIILGDSHNLCPYIPIGLGIPINDLDFYKNACHKYTRLICFPYSQSGEISEFPIKLLFTTRINNIQFQNSSHGELLYNANGQIYNANIYLWRNELGYFFELHNNGNGTLFIYRVKSTVSMTEKNLPSVIYEDNTILLERLARQKEHEIYNWIQTNLPEICPKSYPAYRRMKKQNTKNYQKIVEEAKSLGYKIEE